MIEEPTGTTIRAEKCANISNAGVSNAQEKKSRAVNRELQTPRTGRKNVVTRTKNSNDKI